MAWQRRHFPDFPYLEKHWNSFYTQAPFELDAKFGPLESGWIECGRNVGAPKWFRSLDMEEGLHTQVRKIIRAQASTELGSIQQHQDSLPKAQDPKMQFDVLRIMAEEFRHGYQMIYLLASDDWGSGDFAMDAIEELLEMDTGSHVLDAFNVYFDSFVDNIVFAAVIDRVGKYQLTMQKVFAYAPMARSMSPMLREEAFHLASGVNPLKMWVADATQDRGNVSLENIQQHLNKWIPRGLEMFGDERGGNSNVELGLKSMANDESSGKYHAEVGREVIDVLNRSLVKARAPKLSSAEIRKCVEEIETGETRHGLRREDLFYLPSRRFFRRRGINAFTMVGVDDTDFTEKEDYLYYLRKILPPAYVTGRDFSTYEKNLAATLEGSDVHEKDLPFFG
tara:strand:- start:128 stop:1309 length:1182 start_codon:yes stop_codon:yes gene_type:complete